MSDCLNLDSSSDLQLVLALSLWGVILVLQQWDVFTHAVVESFSTEGLFSFALALIVAKTLHEMGHALVATRLGLRVGHMGIAFVVLWPMLYTDTGESWKLSRSRQRLAIASAGIVTELSLAGLSTLGWALCDPGALRNALLYLATTSWLLSLALNASPFMRFDGYFILSDLLNFPNLHERASALARVTLRRNLLGLQEDWPETFPTGQRRLLVTFAIITWVYRLVLFLGIALAVYLFFFKLLGIILFMVELSWFIAMPVVRELNHWWQHRAGIPSRRKVLFYGVLALIVAGLAIPWHSQIDAVGVARAEHQLRVYAPYPARLQSIHAEGPVKAGETLMVLDEPDIASRLQRPFAGIWLDVNPDWKAGQWVGRQESLGMLIDPRSWQVDAYVAQDQVHRMATGDRVRFYPDGQPTPLMGRVLVIGSTRASQLSHRMLSSRFGGPVPTTSAEHALIPSSALFQVLIQLDEPMPSLREPRGHLKIEGERRSLMGDAATHLMAILMRESGF